MDNPPIDDTEICPACDGSGSGVADTQCMYCGGCGGVPRTVAQSFQRRHQWIARFGLTCCQWCGIVKRRHGENKPCPGKVRVALRENRIKDTPA